MKFLKVFLLSILFLGNANALEVPALHERITDQVGMLSENKKQELTSFLEAHESKTGNQIAVLIIPTLGGDSLEDFSIRVVDQWKLGKKGKDNGVLLLIVKNDRKIRIEVGYGLEGELTDAKTAQIIRNIIVPDFKNGDFARGVEDGIMSIVGVLDSQSGMPTPSDESSQPTHPERIPSPQLIFFLLIFGIIVLSRLFLPGRYRSSGYWSSGGFGGGGGGGGFSGGGGGFGGGGSSGSW